MKEIVFIVGTGGAGDCLESLVCASYIKKAGKDVITYLCTREEIIKPLRFLFDDQFSLELLPEDYGDKFTTDPNFVTEFKREKFIDPDSEFYLSCPDLLFHHPLAFNYKKYNVSLRTLRTTRLLTHKWKSEGKIIYLGLLSNTTGYSYPYIAELATKLANELKEFTIYLPRLSNWANKPIPEINFSGKTIPSNLFIDESPDFTESLKWLIKSSYTLVTDNGPSHISRHLGIHTTIIDPRYGYNRNALMWRARWRADDFESIPFDSFPNDIVRLVRTNLEMEQTNFLPRSVVICNLNVEWKRELFLKF